LDFSKETIVAQY